MYKDFEDYIICQFTAENPTVLDDDFPESYADWVDELDADTWIEYGERYAQIIKGGINDVGS